MERNCQPQSSNKKELRRQLLEQRRKAESGDVTAQYNLGVAYSGMVAGIHTDIEASLKWLRLAAEQRHVDARLLLGQLLILNKNLQGEAIFWLQQLVDEGNPKAMNNLAMAYTKGVGVERDLEVAEKLLKGALESGVNEALVGLATVYSMEGSQQNLEESFKLNQRAIEAGQPGGWYNLSRAYKTGSGGVKQDVEEAFACMKRAAEAGYMPAMSELGRFYHEGLGVARDLQTAREWYEKGVKAGNTECLSLLAQLYVLGQGVDRSLTKGMELFGRAAADGDVLGRLMMAASAEYGLGVAVDGDVARQRYENIVNSHNNPNAMYALGMAYENGWMGVSADPVVAREWFKRAARLGYVPAVTALRYPHSPLQIDPKRLPLREKITFAMARLGENNSEGLVGMSLYSTGVSTERGGCYYLEAVRWLYSAAEKNHLAVAQYIVLCLEKIGEVKTKDWHELYQKLLIPAQEGDQDAIENIVRIHHNWHRQPFRKPMLEIAKWYELLLSKGDNPQICNELANIYYNLGKEGERAAPEVVRMQMSYLRRAFSVFWQFLCRRFLAARQRHKFFAISRALYEKSAAHNNKNAITSLGDLALCGYGQPKDNVKAFGYYQKSAKMGDRAANIYLGIMLCLGIGCEKDEPAGEKILTKMANAKDLVAMYACDAMKIAPKQNSFDIKLLLAQEDVFREFPVLYRFYLPMNSSGRNRKKGQTTKATT